MIELYYSTGNTTNIFDKNISKSIGGAISTTKISGGLNNLFGTISQKDLNYGKNDYRCIYIKNSSLTKNLKDVSVWITTLLPTKYYETFAPIGLNSLWGSVTGWNYTTYPTIYLSYVLGLATIYLSAVDRGLNVNAVASCNLANGSNTITELNLSGWSGSVIVNSNTLLDVNFEITKQVSINFYPFGFT